VTSKAKELVGYSFLVALADGVLDDSELAFLERLALGDGRVDDDERVVLARIFDRVDPERTAAKVVDEIGRFRARYEV